MISDARDSLAGLRLWRREDGTFEYGIAEYGNAQSGPKRTLLTGEPLRLSGVEFIARLPQLTSYVQHFDTLFDWTEVDRRTAAMPVSDLNFEVGSTGGQEEPGTLPGVVIK